MQRGALLARWVELEGCFNFRDLGSYRTADGRHMRAGQVFRADGLQHLTPADVACLRERLHLGGVIDLRSPQEVDLDGRGRIAHEPFDFHHVPLFEHDRSKMEGSPRDFLADMSQLYVFIARAAKQRIAQVMRILAESRTPQVFHCAAGKDRTGVISALLLGLIGVPRETIVADYAFSKQNLDQINARLRASDSYQDLMDELPEGAYEAEPETMRAFLEQIDARYGSTHAWAERAGLGPDLIERLRDRLLE